MLLSLLLTTACSQVTLSYGDDGCTDYDFTDPAPSSLEWESTGDDAVRIWRTNALMEQSALQFTPDIQIEGKTIHVYEAWSGGETDDPFCYFPYVTAEGLTAKVQVRWYLEADDATPFDTVSIEP
jgi:hypothetical protein